MRLFTDKERRTFEQLCSLRENSVIQMMRQYLKSKYDNIIVTPSYLVAIGDIPVGLVAHADTVFKSPPKDFFYDKDKNVMWSPQGLGADDRAGIFAIMKIVSLGQRPHIIITTGEESGCIGASKLVAKMYKFPAELKYLIQLDRRGMDDAVYYECDNEEFEKFVTDHGFKTEWGSYSDIAVLAPVWKVAAVNVSVGYQEEHSQVERLFVDALFDTIDKVQHMLHDSTNIEPFKYVERSWNYASGYYGGWYDDGYSLHKGWFTPLEEGEVRCQFCGEPDKKENYLPLHWHAAADKEMMFHVCNECYAHSVAEIEWCSKCGTGYFLGQNDVKNMPKDRTTWVCKHCKTEEKTNDTVGQEHSGAVQSSNSALSGNSEPTDRRPL